LARTGLIARAALIAAARSSGGGGMPAGCLATVASIAGAVSTR
jgi:hypothetical protein